MKFKNPAEKKAILLQNFHTFRIRSTAYFQKLKAPHNLSNDNPGI